MDDLEHALRDSSRSPVDYTKHAPIKGLERFVNHLSEAQLEAKREQMIRACETANNDPETREIEREMDALPDTMTEEWNGVLKLPASR